MTTYYIAASGSDSNNGSEATPWRNLDYAIDNSDPTDTIIVMTGTNVQTVNVDDDNQDWGSRIVKSATGNPRECILDYNGLSYSRIRADAACEISGITFQNVFMNSANKPLFGSIGVLFEAKFIQDCIFKDIALGRDSSLSRGRSGLLVNGNTNFRRNTCINTRGNLGGNSTNLFGIATSDNLVLNIENCTFYNDGSLPTGTASLDRAFSIFTETGGSTVVNVKNSIFSLKDGFTLGRDEYVRDDSTGTSTLNTISTCLHNFSYTGSEPSVITADPLFVDTENEFFDLKDGSPCIGTAAIS